MEFETVRAKNNNYLFIVMVLLLLALLVISIMNNLKFDKKSDKEFVVFSKSESWGPCPPGERCFKEVRLYSDGRLMDTTRGLNDGAKIIKTLNIEELKKVINIIQSYDLVNINYSSIDIEDYLTTYEISNGKASKIFKDPEIKEPFKKIEKILGLGLKS